MSNKLQELTDRLYNEGLSKGKQEGAEIVKKAETEAGRILSEAQRKAEDIVASARKEAEQIIKKAESDIRTAVSQSLSSTRQQIENMIVAEAAGKAPEELMSNEDFVKKMIAFRKNHPALWAESGYKTIYAEKNKYPCFWTICRFLQYNLKNLVTTSGNIVYLSLFPFPKTFSLCSLG